MNEVWRNLWYTRILSIPEWIYAEAELRASRLPVFDYSRRKEEANVVGCLGEVIAEHWMRAKNIGFASQLNETKHDYLINNSLTIDVKTKDRTVVPKIHYEATVPLYNHSHQIPDYFLFISLHRKSNKAPGSIRQYEHAYILGAISYGELCEAGIQFYKDETDWRNGTKFWTDCLNVQVGQLVPVKETIEIFKGVRSCPSMVVTPDHAFINKVSQMRAGGKLMN
ncbi:hypothetical protein [Marinobacter salexigens]|uniref:Restriction endonuclease n=1 Tax=Marinobacter salexigens TaxID=1925763 RepID=A0ABS6ACR8_9GAMM|nr:hypothetical protein [Marinobacter salexigens]MBU2875544.1 hypothetical protein [Marinobacter salexigens]